MKTLRYAISLLGSFLVEAFSLAGDVPKLSDTAIKLQNAYNQTIEAASKPIRERYLADLKKLQEQSTKTGKLDDAIALRREINRIAGQNIIGSWKSPYGTIVISVDGTAASQGNTASWEIQGSDLVFNWKINGTFRLSSSESGNTMQGKHIYPNGKSVAITLTRIP